ERDRANQQARAKERIADFLKDLFRVSDPSQTRGNSVTAREILDEGVRKINQTLTDQPDTRAELMATMGEVYSSLGLYGEAEGLHRQALGLWRGQYGADFPPSLKAAQDLGYAVSRQGRNDEAEILLKDAVVRSLRVLGKEDRETLRARSR